MDVTTLLLILSAVIAATAVLALVSRRAKDVDAIEPTHQLEELPSVPGAGSGDGGAPSFGSQVAGPTTVEQVAAGSDVFAVESQIASEPAVLAEPEISRMQRLRSRLGGSNNALGRGLFAVFSRDRLDDDIWQDLTDTLIMADVGVESAFEIVQAVQEVARSRAISDPADLQGVVRGVLIDAINPGLDRSLAVERSGDVPAVVLVVGVNGTGKTTTTGKLARLLAAEDHDVLLGAADTFRAAAAEQLVTWGERAGVPVVRGAEGADPASVAFEAVSAGVDNDVDVVIVDTAGRLHTKTGLMDELSKIQRVIEKKAPVTEVLLVIDATTGQNGLVQAKTFADAVPLTGIVLTKLDGSAKGGIIIAVQRELGVPVKLVGLGEGPDDLAPFEVVTFVDELLTP
ncbi:MAG: signal recognition particle-docking protein FtsY [Actinobacteria bacterium]|nr:signal recognition particle-docking protein FtsY [Actinomycetota bacterium]